MKNTNDLFLIPSIMVSMYGLYNIYKLQNKIKEIEQDTEIILKTHNRYMEVQENQHEAIMRQHEAIKDIYNSIEGIACTIPFTNKHEWQNKMIERKFQRELDRHIEKDDQERFEAENMVKDIVEEQRKERKEQERNERIRKLKVQIQLQRINGEDIPCKHEKFFDDESVCSCDETSV